MDDFPPTSVVCGPDGGAGGVEPPDPTKPFVWVGTTDGEGAFRELAPNATLQAISGAQGGQHVWGGARLYAPVEGVWTLRFVLTGDDGEERGSVSVAAEACPGGIAEVTYVTVFLQASPPFSAVLTLYAEPPAGASQPSAMASVPVTVQ